MPILRFALAAKRRALVSLAGGLMATTLPGLAAADSDADVSLYRQRLSAYASARFGLDSYSPLEAVPGAGPATRLSTAAPDQRTISDAGLKAARDYAAANNSSALLVWRNGALQSEDYFGGASASTPLVSKSLAKPLGAIVIGRAIALGKIRSLDQPAADFIPEWRGTLKAAIKIRYLLDMRSGLLEQGWSSDPDSLWNHAYLDPHHGEVLIHQYPLTSPPGTKFSYSNASGDLIAILIERATGERYARFVSEAVLKPIGAAGGEVWVDRPNGLAHSACCILLPAQTWLRLGLLLLQDGRWKNQTILPEGYVHEMLTSTPQDPSYGLGVYVPAAYTRLRGFLGPEDTGPKVLQSEPYLARDLYLFDGAADQVLYTIPSLGLLILRMGSSPPKTPAWDNARLPNLIIAAARPVSGQPPPAPQR